MTDKKERELDALVAVHVMGWKLDEDTRFWTGLGAPVCLSAFPPAPQYANCDNTYWTPSRKIRDAWRVVEKMMTLPRIDVPAQYKHEAMSFHVEVRAWKSSDGWGWSCTTNNTWTACADTAPHAICYAALKAVGVKI